MMLFMLLAFYCDQRSTMDMNITVYTVYPFIYSDPEDPGAVAKI